MNLKKVIELLKLAETEIGEPETTELAFEVWRLIEAARVEAEWIALKENEDES